MERAPAVIEPVPSIVTLPAEKFAAVRFPLKVISPLVERETSFDMFAPALNVMLPALEVSVRLVICGVPVKVMLLLLVIARLPITGLFANVRLSLFVIVRLVISGLPEKLVVPPSVIVRVVISGLSSIIVVLLFVIVKLPMLQLPLIVRVPFVLFSSILV